MKRVELSGAGENAGTVTMGTVRVRNRLMVEIVVHAAVLRAVPWYRGGMGVAILVTPHHGGELDIERSGIEGPYRLLDRRESRLVKLPPVQLRIAALDAMEDVEREAEPVAFQAYTAMLRLTLPIWARRWREPRQVGALAGVA